MIPIRQGDGTGLSASGFSEVRTGDGTVLWSAGGEIPDSQDLFGRWDASDKTDLSSSFPAEAGPELSSTGSPSVLTDQKNGLNVASYDGSDDGHFSTFSSAQSQPNHIFIVYRHPTTPGGSEYLMGGTNSNADHEAGSTTSSSSFEMSTEASETIEGHNLDTNWHIVSMLFHGSNSVIRTDASQTGSGSLSINDDSGISLGWLEWNNGNYVEAHIGEVLYYDTDKSASVGEIESYLADKWGIEI